METVALFLYPLIMGILWESLFGLLSIIWDVIEDAVMFGIYFVLVFIILDVILSFLGVPSGERGNLTFGIIIIGWVLTVVIGFVADFFSF